MKAAEHVAVGDWIRFMHLGGLVVDEVAYLVPRASWDSTIEAMTQAHGCVRVEDILERRSPAHQPQPQAVASAWVVTGAVLAQEEPHG